MVVLDLLPFLFPKQNSVNSYWYYKYYLFRALQQVDRVVVPSASTKNDLLQYSGLPLSHVQVIHLGFNQRLVCSDSQATSAQDSLRQRFGDYFLYIGNQSWRKNLNRLIQALSIIRKHYDVNLVLAGPTTKEDTRSLQETARHYGVQDFVHITGVLREEQLAKILRYARLLVQPSLYEGFGMTPLEGMAAGVPVAVSRCSSLPEVCGDAAIYFDPLDVADMANAIETLLSNDGVRRRCIQKGLGQVKKFDWNITAAKYVQMIATL